MIYTIQLNGKKYGVEVDENAVCLLNAEDINEFEEQYGDLADELPDFDFDDEQKEKSNIVRSTIPGTVNSISVTDGQEVKEGEILATLESMKMEVSITAEYSGTIKKVNVNIGDTVKVNQNLFEMSE